MKIYAKNGWQDTGYKPGAQRDAGAWVTVRAEGQWNINVKDPTGGPRDADGRSPNSGANYCMPVFADYPYRSEGACGGQLIGKLGTDGVPFIVGSWCKISTSAVDPNDSLWLTANDGGLWDNDGALDVTFHVTNLEEPDLAGEKAARIAKYEKDTGNKYDPR